MSLISNCQPSNDVDVADCDFLNVVTVLCEDLHSRTFISSIADDELAVRSHDGDLSWKPELTFFLSRHAEVKLEAAVFLEDLADNKKNPISINVLRN